MRNALSDISTDQKANAETLDNAKLLRMASWRGDVDEVKSLIKKLGRKNLDLTDDYYENGTLIKSSALMYAAQLGHVDVVRILIDAGAKVDMDEKFDDHLFAWRSLDKNGTSLMRAAANGHTEVVKILIAAKVNVNGIALILAAEKGHLEIVKTLIAQNADVNKVNSWNDTALMLAARKGHLEIVNRLIKAGAKVDESNPFGTALMRAAGSGHLEIVNRLIKAGAEVDANHHNTALMWAAGSGHLEIVKTLIAQNADVDNVSKIYTPIMDAINNGHNDIVKFLLGKGANVNLTNKWGDTALSDAVFADKEDSVEVVKLLLEKGALPDSRHGENDDKTLLQIIAEKEIHTAKDLIIAKLLLEKGADLEKIDKQSKLYPLLKIIGNLADDEIKVVANHLEDFKVISNGILMYKSFSEKESGPIQELANDTMSKILIESFPTNLREVFEKDLISKLVNNLLEIYSREEREKREANSLLLAPTLSPPTPPVQDEQPSGSPGCFSCIRIVVAKMLGSNSGIDRQ